jgi:hypothetical protein
MPQVVLTYGPFVVPSGGTGPTTVVCPFTIPIGIYTSGAWSATGTQGFSGVVSDSVQSASSTTRTLGTHFATGMFVDPVLMLDANNLIDVNAAGVAGGSINVNYIVNASANVGETNVVFTLTLNYAATPTMVGAGGGGLMAQTGITSAIGMCLEDTHRQVPISVLSGTNYVVGIANSNPHRFFIVDPGGGLIGKPDIETPDNEIDGSPELTRTLLVGKTYDGSYTFKGDGENMYFPMLGIFGRDLQSVAQTGSPNMWQHIFRIGKYAPSFSVEEKMGDGTFGRLSSGVLIQRMEFDFGKHLTCKVQMMPYRQIPNKYVTLAGVATKYGFGQTPVIIPYEMQSWLGNGTNTWQVTAAPGYVDVQQEQPTDYENTGPFVFASMAYGLAATNFNTNPASVALAAAFLTIDDVPVNVQILEGISFVVDRKIDGSMTGGSGYDFGASTASQVTTTGKISVLFQDETFQLSALSHAKVALNFKLVGVAPGTTGVQQYIFDVYLPNLRIKVPEGPTISDGPMLTGGDFVARRDPTLGFSVAMTLINTVDNTKLAGCWPLSVASNAALTLGVSTTVQAAVLTNFQVNDYFSISSNLGTEYHVASAVTYGVNGTLTFGGTDTATFSHLSGATITRVGVGTNLSAVATATATLTVVNSSRFQVGDIVQIAGVTGSSVISSIPSPTSIVLAAVVTAANHAIISISRPNAGGIGGWTNN